MATLGIEIEDIEASRKNLEFQYEEKLSRERVIHTAPDKKTIGKKAFNVLGLDPSTEKLKKIFGVDDLEVEEAQRQGFEISEEKIKMKRSNLDKVNKGTNRKALEILGEDPSLHKLEHVLGVDRNTLRRAKRNGQIEVSSSPPSTSANLLSPLVDKTLMAFALSLVIAIIFLCSRTSEHSHH